MLIGWYIFIEYSIDIDILDIIVLEVNAAYMPKLI